MERVISIRAVAARSDTLVAAGLAAVSALLVAWLAPPGGDAAAHLYRTELLRDGVALWDNLWFAGHYPLASYSPLYYLPSALVGNVPLVVAAAAAGLATGRVGRRAIVVAASLVALAVAARLLVAVFPSEGRYPYSTVSLAAVLVVGGLAAALAARAQSARPLAAFFVLWGLANVASFLVPSPFGDNMTRLRALVLPLVLLAAVLARFRPWPLAVAALGAAVVFNLGPDLSALPKRAGDVETSEAAFWQPALDFVRTHDGPRFRVEVVPTFGHWEAYHLPRAGVAVARGWYRQLDVAENPELYRRPLEPGAYRAWLRRMGIRHVLLPHARLGPLGADREARLLRSGRSGLLPVFRGDDWTIYRLPRATPLLTGPADAAVGQLR